MSLNIVGTDLIDRTEIILNHQNNQVGLQSDNNCIQEVLKNQAGYSGRFLHFLISLSQML